MFIQVQSLSIYSLKLFLCQIQKKKDKEEFYKLVLVLPVYYSSFQPRISKTSSANQIPH